MNDYLKTVVRVLDRGLKTNSYKFALLRALGDYGEQNQTAEVILLRWLAERLLSYYWPLTVTFRVRQATDPTRDPVVMKFIRQEITDLALPATSKWDDYWRKHEFRFEALIRKCCSPGGCFDEVIPRFHNVRGGAVPSPIYDSTSGGIRLREGAIDFLQTHHRTLQLLAIGGWVQFTEQFTFAPRLYEKIAGIPPERKHERYRKLLEAIQGTKCFYCETQTMGCLHVDHVIPWSFVFEDRVWNLVLACASCNIVKSDSLPEAVFLSRVTKRNSELLSLMQNGNAPLGSILMRRDLQGFNSETLHTHMTNLAENCRAEGFGVWIGATQVRAELNTAF